MSHHAGDGCEREFGPGVHNLGATPRAAVAGGDARAEARQQIARTLALFYGGEEYAEYVDTAAGTHWFEMADEFLARAPAVAAALDLRQRIEELAERWERWCTDCRQGYPDKHADLRRALDAS